MDLRVPAYALFILISYPVFADTVLQPTVISGSAFDDMGSRHMVQPVETYTKEELHPQERTDLSDQLNIIPGVQARTAGSPTLSIRGSQSSPRVLVIEDGIPLNFADGVGFNPLFITPENISSITVVKGPSSALFGHDATAGVVEFNSEKLTRSKFFAGYGSFNTSQVFAGAPIKLGNTKAQVTAYQAHTNGDYPFTIPRVSETSTRTNNNSETVHATLQAENNENESFQWKTFNIFTRQIGDLPIQEGLTPSAFNTPIPFNNWGLLSGLFIKSKLSDTLTLGSRTAYKYLYQDSNTQPGISSGLRQGVSLVKKFGENSIEIFDEYYWEQFSAGYLTSSPSLNLDEAGASATIALNETQTLQPAVRVSSEDGGILPSLGLMGLTPDDWKYFAVYSQGYRPPSLTDRYSQFTNFIPNPNLQPENSSEIDLGFEKKFDQVLVHFDAFGREIKNIIENRFVDSTNRSPENVGSARAEGFEISAEHDGIIKTHGQITYLYNREEDTGNPVPLSPDVQVQLNLSKTLGLWSLQLQDSYWATYYDFDSSNNLVPLGQWNTTDFFLSYNIDKNLTARVALLNIFDQPRELSLGYPEAQRSFSAILQGDF